MNAAPFARALALYDEALAILAGPAEDIPWERVQALADEATAVLAATRDLRPATADEAASLASQAALAHARASDILEHLRVRRAEGGQRLDRHRQAARQAGQYARPATGQDAPRFVDRLG